MASSSNMPATRPRWSNTWLRYEGCSGMTISSEGEPIVKDLQRNTKITQIAKRGAERRVMSATQYFVGIDVANAQLDIALRPTGERWAVANDDVGMAALVERLQAVPPTLMVLEATGGYQQAVVAA